MNTKLLGMLVLICFTQTVYSSECDAILDQGVRNTFVMNNSSRFKQELKSGFCSSHEEYNGGESGGGADVGFTLFEIPISLSGNYSQEEIKSLKDSVCRNDSSLNEGENYSHILQMIADPQIVNAWEKCKTSEGGVILLGEARDEQQVIVTMKFRNSGSIYETRVTDTPTITGMTCDSMIKKDEIINGSTRSYYCRRYANEAGNIIINNTYNGASLYIPKVKRIVGSYPITRREDDSTNTQPKWQVEGCPAFLEQIEGGIPVPIPLIEPQSPCFSKIKKYCKQSNGRYKFLGAGSDMDKVMCTNGRYPVFAY